ncbi:MAG: hypothetical protein V4581_02745, partial [Bacteroidota bacterium]
MKNNPILLLLALVFTIFCAIFIFTLPAYFDRFNFTETGQIGDTIGGLSGPIIGIIGIYYVYKTYVQQINERWYQINNKTLTDIDADLNPIFVLPTGEKEKYNNYDSTIQYSGLSAMTIIIQMLDGYDKLNKFERLAVDQFIFEYGRKVKYLEIFMINIISKKNNYKSEFDHLNYKANDVYYG